MGDNMDLWIQACSGLPIEKQNILAYCMVGAFSALVSRETFEAALSVATTYYPAKPSMPTPLDGKTDSSAAEGQ
jgi:hypothetical protein